MLKYNKKDGVLLRLSCETAFIGCWGQGRSHRRSCHQYPFPRIYLLYFFNILALYARSAGDMTAALIFFVERYRHHLRAVEKPGDGDGIAQAP